MQAKEVERIKCCTNAVFLYLDEVVMHLVLPPVINRVFQGVEEAEAVPNLPINITAESQALSYFHVTAVR